MRTLLILSSLLLAHPALAATIEGTFKMDPVELVAGRETPGNNAIAAERYQYRYLFSSEQNREEFRKNPEKYEIQLAGACGRMGLLSGAGDLDRYAVHDGHIYLFASDQCKRTFLLDPDAVLDPDDAPITTDAATTARARELIDRAVAAMGGPERLDAVRSYRHTVDKTINIKGEPHSQSESLTLLFPAGVRKDNRWDDQRWTYIETPDAAWYESGKGEPRELQPVERRFITRTIHHRNPLAVFRARNQPGFLASHAGMHTIGFHGKKITVEEVNISYDGCTVTLGFDANTGLLRTESFVGRQGKIGDIILVFTEHNDVSGLKVPSKYEVLFDGVLKEGAAVEYTSIIIDDPGAADLFKKN